jgi:hypothetical protein
VNWIIFFAYLVLFCWLVTVVPFFRRSKLSKVVLCGLFLIKILAGIAYFQFYSLPANKPTSDTWKFYKRSIPETDLLLKEPVHFASGFFSSKYESTGGLFSDNHSYWNDVKDLVMVKLMAVVNVFTFKNYYANIIFFNFIFFFGLIAFYRLMKEIYPDKKWLLIGSIFLLPSFLFWCSGIHKDGLIFSALGMVLYSFHRMMNRRSPARHLVAILFFLAVIFLLRNYIVLVLVPCMIIGYLAHLFPAKKFVVMGLGLLLGFFVVFTGKYIHPSLNIPAYIADKQMQFRTLEGGSAVNIPPLQPGFSSFVGALPAAVDLGFFRPHPTEPGLNSRVASVEMIMFWLLVLVCLLYNRGIRKQPPVVWTCLLFAFLILLIIGYTVPFSGAVVRYRSLILPLVLAPLIGGLALTPTNIIKKYM